MGHCSPGWLSRCFARGTFEPRPFKGIPTVVRLGAPWGLGVPRASPPGRSPGWWGVARGPPFVLSYAFSVLSFCLHTCTLTVLLFAFVWLLIATGACRARRAARDCGVFGTGRRLRRQLRALWKCGTCAVLSTRALFLRARRSSLVARTTPFSSPCSPLASLLAGALARPRARAGAEAAVHHARWLGLPPAQCLLHALSMEKFWLTMELC